MEFFRVVRFSEHLDKKDHYPRSWVVLEEAKRRGIKIEAIHILKRVSTYYRATLGNKRYYFDAVASRFLHLRLDEKHFVKHKLLKHGFPTPEGKLFWNTRRALRYGRKLGFPLVVKPAHGTHAYHVTAPVRDENALRQAIRSAKEYQPRFVVERYLTGELYRITVIDFNKVFVARREAPNIVGDGTHTIRELIEIKNAHPHRGETGQKDSTLHKIPLAGSTFAALEKEGLHLDYIPTKGAKVFLHSKISIGSGGDIFEETSKLHPENREMFRRVARLFGTDLIGLDFIASDISQPYTEQTCGIIEANSIPMIDFHHNPAFGEPQNPAAVLWDAILADKRIRYLHPVMLPQRSLFTRLTWHFMDITMPLIRDFMLKFRIVRRLARRQRFHVGWIKPEFAPERAVAHLKMNGFEVVRPEWIDHGEVVGLRKLLNHERQCHIRFFEDGEVRAHVEYAPEARPFAHLLEQGFHAAQNIVYELLHEFIERRAHPAAPVYGNVKRFT